MNAGSRKSTCHAALLAGLLAGCSVEPPAPKPTQSVASGLTPVNLSGYSAPFKEGYSDGCTSAGARNERRNDIRYKTEADYMMGWNDGFSLCRKHR
jgi:hypothetical protein